MGAGKKLFLFDLDGTLLRSDKTISKKTLAEVSKLRNKGNMVGISTSRSEQNCKSFLGKFKPDIMVVSGGALVKKENEYIFKAVFSKGVTKEDSIRVVCDACGLSVDDIIAFGDDYADIGMLKLAGIGVAMGNAIEEVKKVADIVIGTNDEDGIADYLKKEYKVQWQGI